MPKKKTLPRLLNLYPVEVLRERWDIKGTKEEIATEAAENTSRDDIAEFCRAHQGRTKQRILLFDNVSESLAGFGKPLLANQEPAVVSRTAQKLDEFYLFDVSYRAVVGDGSEWKEVHVTFEWPVRVTVDKRIVQLTFTIIEKNIGNYLPGVKNALGVKKDIDEEDVIKWLIAGLGSPDIIQSADINKGVKQLWEAGDIDAEHSKWKGPKGTLTETMDVKCLLRRDDPAAFQEAMKGPLLKTVFTSLTPAKKFPPRFTVDPSAGEVAITSYPETAEEMANVVRAILSAN